VAALRLAGIAQALIDAPAEDAGQFDSEALWALLAHRPWQGQRVLVVRGAGPSQASTAPPRGSAVHAVTSVGVGVRGQSAGSGVAGRDWLARQLEAAGAQVDFACVYERRAPLFSAQQLQRMAAAARDGSVWLFSSSEAVGNLPPHDWSGSRAVATHPRIAEAVRQAGWGVVVQSRPALGDIMASIESIQP
jgi:uroporphyrinogen-III synthase